MKEVTRRIIAWTGLVFMTAFSALMITSFFNADLLWGKIVYVALACLIVGLVLFAMIYFDNKERRAKQQAEDEEKARRAENKRKREQNQAKIAEQNVQNAQLTYDLNQTRYREGDITGMEMSQFQTQLSNKKITYTQALINYRIELLNLKILSLYDFDKNIPLVPMKDIIDKK